MYQKHYPFSFLSVYNTIIRCLRYFGCCLKYTSVFRLITRKGDNFVHTESLCRGAQFLAVIIQIMPVHNKFDIELC